MTPTQLCSHDSELVTLLARSRKPGNIVAQRIRVANASLILAFSARRPKMTFVRRGSPKKRRSGRAMCANSSAAQPSTVEMPRASRPQASSRWPDQRPLNEQLPSGTPRRAETSSAAQANRWVTKIEDADA